MIKTKLLLTALLLTICSPTLASESAALKKTQLKGQVQVLMNEAHIPGLTLATWQNGGKVWVEHLGVASNETQTAITDETLFEAASLSKPVLAMIVSRLVERGEFSMYQPLHDILPHPRLTEVDLAQKLNARNILSHQSGLPNWGAEELTFVRPPGQGFGYSGEGYLYLQRVLEKHTGLDFQILAKREVFDPLGMKHSYFTWSRELNPSRADGHGRAGDAVRREIPDANAASSLYTTAKDYACFVRAWVSGRLWKKDSFNADFLSLTPLMGDERGASAPFPESGSLSWGLGWGIQSSQGSRIVWHWGDNGVFRAFVAFNLQTASGVVLLTNSENGMAIAQRVAEPIVGDMSDTFHWLQYPQSDAPGWQQAQLGFVAQFNGNLPRALVHFTRSAKVDTDNAQLNTRVKWLEEYLGAVTSPLPLKPSQLDRFPGQFGPRKIVRKDNDLFYQRGDNPPTPLVNLGNNLFALQNVAEFRLEVVLNEAGDATALTGHYLWGGQDTTDRNPE